MKPEMFLLETVALSSLVYLYLHRKTKISLKYLYLDNIAVIVPIFLLAWYLDVKNFVNPAIISVLCIPPAVPALAFTYTMIRFWRTPVRRITAEASEIISPADGNIIYIHRIEPEAGLTSVKKGRIQQLKEFRDRGLTERGGWHIGINMTPFDVHKNCSPISGTIVMSHHFSGKYLSLKAAEAFRENERHSYIIENEKLKIGIIQIASRLVRRIDSYVKEGDTIERGKWLGMIRFGSQVDVILPPEYVPVAEVGMQVYAARTVLAEYRPGA